MNIKKLLIANRGEIAVRIIRAAKELGIRTVQVHSAADTESLAVKMADEAVNIGRRMPRSLISISRDILTRRSRRALTPYIRAMAFLAENAGFADAVEKAGLIFVGPKGDSIRIMGDKVAARIAAPRPQACLSCRVPTGASMIPSSAKTDRDGYRLSGHDQGVGGRWRTRHPYRA